MSSFRQNQDRNFEPQRYRARSPNLVTAIVLWNTMYLERITWGWSRQVGGRRAAAIPVAAGLGAHQPDWRLRLAAEPQAGDREVQAATIARKTLAYDFFRILRAPHVDLVQAERAARDGRRREDRSPKGQDPARFWPGLGLREPFRRSRTRTAAGSHRLALRIFASGGS